MALPTPPLDPNYPIPNNPFYAPESNYLNGEYGPLIIGSGLFLDNATGTLYASGSGGPGVSSITATTGIYVSQSTGSVIIGNSGVLALTPGPGINVVNTGGNYTITNTAPAVGGGGTVTSVTAGTGLAGGTITNSGTLSLAPSGVGPGVYTNPTITVDAYGRIILATPGSGAGGFPVLATLPLRSTGLLPSTISIDAASTSTPGAVRLNDTVTSTSTSQAATPRAVKETYDLANAAQVTAGTATSAAAAATLTANNASTVASSASASATQALTCAVSAQTNATQALTNAATAQSTANTALTTANTANTTANTALTVANGAVSRSAFLGPGQLLVGTGAGTFSALNPGTNGLVLTACSGSPSGLVWSPAVASGTVTCVRAGTGLCGGPITTSGTLCLTDTGIFPGIYNNASFTVDAQGRILTATSNPTPLTSISAASPISATSGAVPVISVSNATLTSAGVVQLYNNTNSTSISLALTAAQGKNLQDQINSLSSAANITLAGTFDAATSQMVTVTADGTPAGFIVGSNIPAAATGNSNYFVIVTTEGSYNPPGGGGPYNASQGDWFLSNGISWQFLNVGPTVPYASTTFAGTVCLSTTSLAIAGTDSTTAITPSVGRSTYVFKCDYTAKGAIVAGTGAGATNALAVGVNGSVLVACSTCPTGLTWASSGSPAIPCACVTGKGALVSGSGAGLPLALPVGANGCILTADSTTPTGLAWSTNTAIPCSILLGKGDIVAGSAPGNPTALPAGINGYVLTTDSTCAAGLKWAAAAASGVTCVCTGTGLTGGPISTVGTIALGDTAVVPGTYNNATIDVDQQGRLTFASSGTAGGGTVTCVCTGVGLTGGPIGTTGTIALANTAVTLGSYTLTNITVDQQGRITSASNGTAVTCVCAGTGLTGGPVTGVGTLCLSDTAVTPGSYTYTTVNVDQQGRILFASNGTAPNTTTTAPAVNTGTAIEPIIGVQTATTGQLGAVQVGSNIDVSAGVISVGTSSTTVAGIVQLNDTVASTSTTEALTAAQGKNLQDQINALAVTTNLTLAGTFDASTGQLLAVTSSGSVAGFVVGNDLPAASAGITDFFVIVTSGGSYSPPGGGGPYPANQGDWFLCDGTVWEFLNVGTDLPTASTGTQGIVQLATPAQTATGTSTTLAVTPAGACSTYIPYTALLSKGVIISASGANTLATLGVGTNGQTLTACTAATSGLCWVTPTPAIPCSCITAKGTLITGTTANTPVALPIGTNGQVLTACDTCSTGMVWLAASVPVPAIPCALLTSKGDIIVASAANTPTALPVGTDGQSLTACAACPEGVVWVTPAAGTAAIPCSCLTAKGSLVTASAAALPVDLPVGTDGQVLVANSACTPGLQWQTGAVGAWTSAGTIQSVGWGATGTVPSNFGTTTTNNISYRQIGPKEWEVVGTYYQTGLGSGGSGSYLFTLPNSLAFNTTLPFQQTFTLTTTSSVNIWYVIPFSQSVAATSGDYSGFLGGVVPYDNTRYRVIVGTNSSSNFWGASYVINNALRFIRWSFTFTSA